MIGISIIVPAFNVEKSIDRCMESIVSQTYRNWEIIIVNDGSTDKTREKVEKWEKNNSRIHVITQENQGSGPARNTGMEKAKGKYIMFIDPDDWIDNGMLQEYWERAENKKADLIISNSVSDYYDGRKYISSEFGHIDEKFYPDCGSSRKNYLKLFVLGLVRGPVCKLYVRDIIEKNDIKFPNLRRSQDLVFNYLYYDKIESVYVFDSNYYHYIRAIGNQRVKIKNDYYKAISKIYSDIYALHEKWGIKPEHDDYLEFCNYLFDAFLYQLQAGESALVMKDIVCDKGIIELAKNTVPKSIKRKGIRVLILSKRVTIINLCMGLYKKQNEVRKKL